MHKKLGTPEIDPPRLRPNLMYGANELFFNKIVIDLVTKIHNMTKTYFHLISKKRVKKIQVISEVLQFKKLCNTYIPWFE